MIKFLKNNKEFIAETSTLFAVFGVMLTAYLFIILIAAPLVIFNITTL